ncbi:S24 family peptidase, partial [Acinetobacter baumannii]
GPGGLLDSDRAAGETIIDPALIRRLRLDPAHLSAITAEGESMLPSVMPGDTLLVDRRDQRLTARGGIYVLRADGVLMVKRVARHGSVLVVTS